MLRSRPETRGFSLLRGLRCLISMSSSIDVILNELRSIRERLDHIETLLEERLIGVEEPLPDEVEAIENYERRKAEGRLSLVELEDLES